MKLAPLGKKPLPKPLPLLRLIGPSFILLGLGLGSGEIILWPYLVANWGLGIIWGALLGITFQFFMNMEIERYTLATGESVFVGFARKLGRLSPVWFILSTLIPWMWPGIIASSGKLLAQVAGLSDHRYISIGLLLLIGAILTLGPTLYKTVERFQKTIILLGVPFILVLVFLTASNGEFLMLLKGLVGVGEGYRFLPPGIALASFLAAFAYTGAGGNLNLAQSYYVKEKGYAMGIHSGKITSLLTGKSETIELEGSTFEAHSENLASFKKWWKVANIEHLIVFWGTGLLTILLLSLLAYSNVFGLTGTGASINFVILEGSTIGAKVIPFVGTLFITVAAIFLFATQLTVLDATSRIMAENTVIFSPQKFLIANLPKFYYLFLWIQVILGIAIFALGIGEPLFLLTVGAVLNALAMFVHIGATLWLNLTSLEKSIRPALLRIGIMLLAFIFFGGFSIFTLSQYILK